MSDNRKEAEAKMEKAIFISADCWLCAFDLLSPRKLGLGIALISHGFDFYVDEHFKTRKWTFGIIRIGSKIGKNGTKEMDVVNCYQRPMPIPQNPLPKKVVGFKAISLDYIDRNAIAFLHRFRQLFAVCPINLSIQTARDDYRISEFILRNIWPMLGKNIHAIEMSVRIFNHLRQFIPSILNECPPLRVVSFSVDLFIAFPADDNAAASDGQSVAKWLFTPLHNNVPKVLRSPLDMNDGFLVSDIEDIKTAFASASSPVNFIVVIQFRWSFASTVVPFALTNELTREQLALKRTKWNTPFLLVRCPIARDESKWAKWEKEADWRYFSQWNQIGIKMFSERDIGDGILDATPGPSDQ